MTSLENNPEAMQVEEKIRTLAESYARDLEAKTNKRVTEMDGDDTSHRLIYRVLGVSEEEGHRIDIYQNKGRFLYNDAGAFLEKAAVECFRARFPSAASRRIPNTRGKKPKTFGIDCVIERGATERDAIEIKWRDATTDGDHIAKENDRVSVIAEAGYRPVRVMFYAPQRKQAIEVQRKLEKLYADLKGQYFHGPAAWKYVHDYTGLDLKAMLERIAKERSE